MVFDYRQGSLLIVELDRKTHLSTIKSTYWESDPETVSSFVLRSLGAESLVAEGGILAAMISPPHLVLEGVTDWMYLLTLSKVAKNRVKCNLVGIWLPVAHGNASVAPLALFLSKLGLDVAVLYDNDPGSIQESKMLLKENFDSSRILFVECEGGKEECDIEDLFPRKLYLKAVNEFYSKTLKDSSYIAIKDSEIKSTKEKRIVKAFEHIWKKNTGKSWGKFDKKAVCDKLCELILEDQTIITDSILARFTHLFDQVWKCLEPKAPESEIEKTDSEDEEDNSES